MTSFETQFAPFAERMRGENLPEIAIRTFQHYYHQLVEGQTGLIPESEIEPVEALPDADKLDPHLETAGQSALKKTILLKLNGGLGTSMGLQKAKSLLPVKQDLSFLDIIAHQAQRDQVPLVLMNSFVTQDDTLKALEPYPDLAQYPIPQTFVQHKVPKVVQADLSPATWPDDPDLEWCPPGHGDIYTALVTSGMLADLLEAGYQYAFVSNSDNLGAELDLHILGYFVKNQLPFMMEVADRTDADKKGGHLAQQEGQFILRESAQCPAEDEVAFQDISRHKYFNTNNLWINLKALKTRLEANDNILGLPMIRNRKTVDPRDGNSTPVYQLETAMGSAIGVFEKAQALRVPRTRFAPVKKTNDLLLVRSDAYILTEDFRVVRNPEHPGPLPIIDLDPDYYKFVTDLDRYFPAGIPSLEACTALKVGGEVTFGPDLQLRGWVEITNSSGANIILADRLVEGRLRF